MANNSTSSGATDADSAARCRRRVCNLTPSQVEKKRSIDRTNQQHWRQKKRLYIATLEAEVARLKVSLAESHAKLHVYEAADMGVAVNQGVDTSSSLSSQSFRGELAAVIAPSVPAEGTLTAIPTVPGASYLPPLLPAPIRGSDIVAHQATTYLSSASASASPASIDGTPFIPSAAPNITQLPCTYGPSSSSAPSNIGLPLSIVTPAICRRGRLASRQSEAQIRAQAQAHTEDSLLNFFDPTHSFQLFDHSLSNAELDVDVTVDVGKDFGAQQPIYTSGLVSTQDLNCLRRHQLQDHQQHNQQRQQQRHQHTSHQQLQQPQQQLQRYDATYHNIRRYQTLHGTAAPSPFSTHFSYLPYYLAGRYKDPSPGMPDWMVLPLNLPVATELDKLVLITSQVLVQRYSTSEFSLPVFPSIEGFMSHLRTDNTPHASRRESVYGGSDGGDSSSVIGEELLRALAEASAGGPCSTLSSSSLAAAAKASAAAAAAVSPPPSSDTYSSEDDDSSIDTIPRPILAAVSSHVVWKSPLKRLTLRLAFLYKLAHFLRWCLCPTKENYDALPDHLKPTLLQRRVPHPVWVDLIVWPDVRDNLIRGGDYSAFELFRFVTGNTMTVNWPYTDSETFMKCADGKRLAFNPVFEAHIRNIDNFSVGCQAAAEFPFLNPYARVT